MSPKNIALTNDTISKTPTSSRLIAIANNPLIDAVVLLVGAGTSAQVGIPVIVKSNTSLFETIRTPFTKINRLHVLS